VRARPAASARVLLVDDSEGVRSYLASLLQLRGFAVDTAGDGRSALALLGSGAAPDVVLLDVMMPGLGGLETLRRVRELHPTLPVVVLSVVGKATTIVEAMQLGASDYLNKPFEEEELVRALERALGGADSDPTPGSRRPEGPLWSGPTLTRVRSVLEQIADTDVTVLIQGESGVGKEIVARAVHDTSARRTGPFVKVNCAALPGTLLESELFGYERGAFTGAVARKPGRFELASGGTIFLDEIGEMSPAMQAKLLHVLQDARFARLGGNREIEVDARVVAATNRDLEKEVKSGKFREDLFYRLQVMPIVLPPLRERRGDVVLLANYYIDQFNREFRKRIRGLTPAAIALLEQYQWPGNVRELKNAIERAMLLIDRDYLEPQDFTLTRTVTPAEFVLPAEGVNLDEVERQLLVQALERSGGNQTHAAQLLGINRDQVRYRIEKFGLAKA
jgi:DNA-binding NtrC family response regulator